MIVIQKLESPTLIIDGDNLLHRAFWISKDKFINSKGQNTGVTYSGVRMIKSYVDQFGAKNVYVAWDYKLKYGQPNFRKLLSPEYKGNRPNDEKTQKVHEHEKMFWEVLESLGVRNIFPGVLEADDVISWLTKTIPGKKLIISNDGDLLQLINSETCVYNPLKKKIVSEENFEEFTSVKKNAFVLFKAIKGDDSDYVKGLPGHGPVKAKKVAIAILQGQNPLNEEQNNFVQNNIALVDLNVGIQTEKEEIPLFEEQFNKLQTLKPDFQKFHQHCVDLEFPSILKRFDDYKNAFGIKNENLA